MPVIMECNSASSSYFCSQTLMQGWVQTEEETTVELEQNQTLNGSVVCELTVGLHVSHGGPQYWGNSTIT